MSDTESNLKYSCATHHLLQTSSLLEAASSSNCCSLGVSVAEGSITHACCF